MPFNILVPTVPMSLSTLSSLLLPADAPEDTVDWSRVSSKLSSLRSRTQEELRAVETALAALPGSSISFTVDEHDDVLNAYKELKVLGLELSNADEHFQKLKSILSPYLTTLQSLQSQAKYLEIAIQVEKSSQIVKEKAIEMTPDGLETFQSLKSLVASIPVAYTVLRNEATRRVDTLWRELRCCAVEKLRVALEKIQWPEPLKTQQEWSHKVLFDDKKQESELSDVSVAFAFLLTLQLHQQSEQLSATTELWAINCVLEPLEQRFRYHFERKESATNRLAKPEWYLSHIHEQLNLHTRFLAQILTPVLHRHRHEIHCWDAQILLLRGLVKAVGRKLIHDMATLIAYPPLLCHTLDEVLLFERLVDDEFGYESWASLHRRAYPRCVDAFTSTNDVLFAWTNVDVEYSNRLLSSIVEADDAWQLEDQANDQDDVVPPAAVHFVSLLDFLSQRFTYMETEEHRYLYVMQVHMPLLRRFQAFAEARGRQLTQLLTQTQDVNVWKDLFVVVNALEHVAQTLAAWDQSRVFLELAKKVARCETTREHVLAMHVAYSKQVFARASAAVLASEEATAVRQALAGPGAMIGPSAAFSAAYSVGSKTMRNLFRRAETDAMAEAQDGNQVDRQPPAANGSRKELLFEEEEHEDPATLFANTIFEWQIQELKSLTTTLLEAAKMTLVRALERPMGVYSSSSKIWTMDAREEQDKNRLRPESCSDLPKCYTLISNVLACARQLLVPPLRFVLLKPLAASLDRVLFDSFYHPQVTQLSTNFRPGIEDVKSLTALFATGSSESLPPSSFRLMRDVCCLLEMPLPRVKELAKALNDENVICTDEETENVDQIATMLEACGIFSLTPAQAAWICTKRLDDSRETSQS